MSNLETQYDFNQNTILIHIQLLPKTDANQPRNAVLAVGIKNSPPIITSTTVEQLELPTLITKMLSQLEAELPERKAAALKLAEEQETEEISQNYKQRKVEAPPPVPSSTQTSTTSPQKHQLTLF
ncbi:hypothetical protein H6S82_00760 [Planktothrix sp. FACHB-1355]|uniref:Uncharacterized protein n=1 Tax=Aerosakkonema funiforme FACHB-1375 TaxID=2949571 RepID=A0A926VAI4_9CYAN|nr:MULTISPECIES: hypothetical protein [Oscillatoriales]MBD2180304.1 hypothetical protein [Aerosakkonema funiforme FACHB-1375]MBD3557399.1 hypothetical protein [Planktothrix sp. FACHB-1355]